MLHDPRSSSEHRPTNDTRSDRFTLTVNVQPGHPAYDDPERPADAAWEALPNEYDLRAAYTDIEEVEPQRL